MHRNMSLLLDINPYARGIFDGIAGMIAGVCMCVFIPE